MSKLRRILLLASLTLVVGIPALAQDSSEGTSPASKQAQDSADPQQSPQQQPPQGQVTQFIFVEGSLPYVPGSNTIAAKLPLSLQLTPFNIGIVTRPLFEEQYGVTVSDALVNISNLNVQPGNGVHDFFLIRGFDSLSSSLIMTDGASEPEVTFYELYNVENVEVLKGPSGFLYGSNPLAGTVNLVRKQPLPGTRGSARATFGRYEWVEGAVDFNYGNPSSDFFFRVNSLFRDRGGYRDRIGGRTFAINPAATWQIDDDASFNVNFEYVLAEYIPDSGLPLFDNEVPDVPRTNNYQSPFDTSDQDVYRLQVDYQNEISSTFRIRNKFYYRGLNWVSNGTLYNGVFPELTPFFQPTGNLIVSRNLTLLDDEEGSFGNQLEGIFDFVTGSAGHNLLVGFELARMTNVFTLDAFLLPNIDLNNPRETTPPVGSSLLQVFASAGDSRAIVAAPYAIDQIWLHDRVHLLAGVRIDTIDFQDSLNSVSRRDTKASPMLGLVFVPVDDLSIYGNYSKSFAPPAARVQTGNVEPEEGEQLEVGVKRELLDGRARVTFAAYQLERQNIGIPDNNGITQQIGTQRSRGFEAEFAAEPQPDLRFVGSYAYNSAVLTEFSEQIIVGFDPFFQPVFGTVDRSGNRPAFAPQHVFNAWLSKSFNQALIVGGGARYVSDQFIAEDNSFVIDSVFTIAAVASYAYRDIVIDLNIKNLTNREYNLRGFGDTSITPADPVTAYIGVTYRR